MCKGMHSDIVILWRMTYCPSSSKGHAKWYLRILNHRFHVVLLYISNAAFIRVRVPGVLWGIGWQGNAVQALLLQVCR